MKNKKANIMIEGATIIVILFVLAIISVVGYQIFTEVNTEIQADNEISNTSKVYLDTAHTQYPTLFDGIFIFLLVGFWIAAIVFSFLIDTHPIFLVISLLLIAIILVVAAFMTNSYEEIIGDAEFSAVSTSFPMTNFVMGHLIETILVITMSIVISLFAKSRI